MKFGIALFAVCYVITATYVVVHKLTAPPDQQGIWRSEAMREYGRKNCKYEGVREVHRVSRTAPTRQMHVYDCQGIRLETETRM